MHWRDTFGIRQFLTGTIGGSLLANAITAVATDPATWPQQVLPAALGAGVFVVALLWWAAERGSARRYFRHAHVVLAEPLAPKRTYLVMAPSRLDVAAAVIDYHLPALRKCWLLVTTENLPYWGSAADTAAQLQAKYASAQLLVEAVTVEGPFDVEATRAATAGLLHRVKQLDQEYTARTVVDITGSTALMTIGMAAAAVDAGVDMSFVPTRYQKTVDRATGQTRLVPTGEMQPPSLIALGPAQASEVGAN